MVDKKFQAALPISLRSRMLFDLLILVFLFLMYLDIWHSNFLMFLESKRKYSKEP